jgi:hypothetical protein
MEEGGLYHRVKDFSLLRSGTTLAFGYFEETLRPVMKEWADIVKKQERPLCFARMYIFLPMDSLCPDRADDEDMLMVRKLPIGSHLYRLKTSPPMTGTIFGCMFPNRPLQTLKYIFEKIGVKYLPEISAEVRAFHLALNALLDEETKCGENWPSLIQTRYLEAWETPSQFVTPMDIWPPLRPDKVEEYEKMCDEHPGDGSCMEAPISWYAW